MAYSSRYSTRDAIKRIFLSGLMTLFFAFAVSLSAQAETININKADVQTLQHYLSGIGKVKAKAIVTYRKKHGKFKTVEDLTKVPGIGKATLEKNRKLISTSRGIYRLDAKKSKAHKEVKPSKTKG